MTDDNLGQQQLAITIAQDTTVTEAEAVREWAWNLLQIRDEKLPVTQKAKKAIALTASSKVILPALKIVARHSCQAKRGIDPLGGAIGVPLWVVFGGGSMFAKYLYDELTVARRSG